jgi:hypothetical protein
LHLNKAPIEKLRCICQCTTLISDLIKAHYDKVDFDGKNSKLQLDADALINICIFILLNSQLTDIFAHLKLANQFATTYMRNSKLGYVASTFEVAIE